MDATSSNAERGFDGDVLVVGAGPIGLVTACALAHHGAAVHLVERRTEPRDSSRANNLWARVQELLESVALRQPLADKSYRVTKQTQLVDGRPLDQVRLDAVGSPFAEVLYSGQGVIERTLIDEARARGVAFHPGFEVTRLDQDGEGVTVDVAEVDGDGERTGATETRRFRYLVGADGNEGFVRRSVGLAFEPTKLPGRAIRSIDAKLRWQRPTDHDQLWFFTYHNGFGGVMPVWEGYHRLFFLEDEDAMPAREPTLEEMQARARETLGDATLTLSDPIWTSFGRFQHGVAPGFAKGRVFLAGDAGHTTLPIGGQGMNAGIHDAVGLAWRLAMALAGQAAPAVLASYDAERRAHHAALDAQQAKGFGRLVYRNALEDAALGAVGRFFPGVGAKLLANDDLQQLGVGYPDSPLSEDHLKARGDRPGAGDRAPDAPLVDADGRTRTLFDVLYGAEGPRCRWTLLAFDGRDPDAVAALRAAGAALAPWGFVRTVPVVSAPAAMAEEAPARDSLSDLDRVAHRAYGVEDTPALVLVRPDGHVAFRGPAGRADLLRAYCERTFARPLEVAA